MSKKLYIHIGAHKTGTTSIQKALVHNLVALERKGLYYFSNNPDGTKSYHNNLFRWFENFSSLGLENGYFLKNIDQLSREISKLPGNVLISSEQFFWIFMKDEIKNFKISLDKYFDEIEIIIYLRRQDQQIVSQHNQGSKFLETPEHLFLGSNPHAMPKEQKYFRLYLDYHQKLSMWAEAFGKDNLTIRVFDKKKLLNGDAVNDFFHLIGIEDFKTTSQSNESNGLEKTKVGLLMNQANVNSKLLRNIINRNLDSHTKLLPKREDAQQFYEQYRESNIALNKMFNISEKNEAIFSEDFSMYPEEGNELWTEEGVNETMITLFKSLNETYGTINYNALFQAAVKLEKSDFKLSYEMMKMLQRLIPNDPNIHKKIKSYDLFIETMKKK